MPKDSRSRFKKLVSNIEYFKGKGCCDSCVLYTITVVFTPTIREMTITIEVRINRGLLPSTFRPILLLSMPKDYSDRAKLR